MNFIGNSTRAIVFRNGTQWPNGLYASEIIVRNNHIEDSSFDHVGRTPPLAFFFYGFRTEATTIGPRNILIEGNFFVDCPRPEIGLTWTRNAVIRNNRAELESGKLVPVIVSQSNSENIQLDDQ